MKISAVIVGLMLCMNLFMLINIGTEVSGNFYLLADQSRGGPTDISGVFSSNTTLYLANSPYIVKGNILVEKGSTMTIEPGVELRFDGDYYLQIEGKLLAQGTNESMINFTSNKETPNTADWNAIIIRENSDPTSIIKYCSIQYSSSGIHLDVHSTDASIIISHNNIQNNRKGIWFQSYKCTTLVDTVQVSNNLIYNNHDGMDMQIYDSFNSKTKINIVNNTIVSNVNGLYFSSLKFDYDAEVSFHYNNIFNNTAYDALNTDELYDTDVNGTYNWWGTNNSGLIDQHIFDYYDNYNNAKIIYKPFLTGPNQDAPRITDKQKNNSQNNPPIADAGPNQTVGVNQIVYFDGSGSYDPDQDSLIYNWTYGDGQSLIWSAVPNTTHMYDYIGTYTATLSVNDGQYLGTDSCTITVINSTEEKRLVFNELPTVTLDEDSDVYKIDLWNYAESDRVSDYGLNFTIIENTNPKCGVTLNSNRYIDIDSDMNWYGSTFVRIKVNDGYQTEYQNLTVIINPVNDVPIAVAGPDQVVMVNDKVYFDGSGSYDIENDPLTYKWQFGDGDSAGKSNNSATSHIYKTAGLYTVTLTVNDGNSDSVDTCLVMVNDTDEPPGWPLRFDSDPQTDVVTGEEWSYKPLLNHTGDGPITLSLEEGPDGMELKSGELTWTPTGNQTGTFKVKLKAADGVNTVFQEFNLEVKGRSGINNTRPRIISTTPEEGSNGISVSIYEILVKFSEPMNDASVEAAISLSPNVKYSLFWVLGSHNAILMIRLENGLLYNKTYTLTIDSSAKDLEGDNLVSTFKLQFTTESGSNTNDEDSSDSRDLSGDSDLFSLLLILVILIILTLFIMAVLKKKKKAGGRGDLYSPAFDGRTKPPEEPVRTDYPMAEPLEGPVDDPDMELIDDLGEEALSPDRFGGGEITNEEMLNTIKEKFEKGEISKAAYDSIADTMSTNR